MKNSLFFYCIVLVLASCRNGQDHFSQQALRIEYVELIYTDLDDLTPIGVGCESLETFPNIDRDTIFNPDDIVHLEAELSTLMGAEVNTVLDGIDARAIMVVHGVDGVETVYCVGNGAIQTGGRIYTLPDRIELWLRAHTD